MVSNNTKTPELVASDAPKFVDDSHKFVERANTEEKSIIEKNMTPVEN
jgi:hypothetical protein